MAERSPFWPKAAVQSCVKRAKWVVPSGSSVVSGGVDVLEEVDVLGSGVIG